MHCSKINALVQYKYQRKFEIEKEQNISFDQFAVLPISGINKICFVMFCFIVSFLLQNTQMLSQFVSPYTGRMYGRQVTGLCLHMQRRVAREIRIAKYMGKISK